jgi:hypothetical protein
LPDCHLVSRSYSLPVALMGGAGHYLALLLAQRKRGRKKIAPAT